MSPEQIEIAVQMRSKRWSIQKIADYMGFDRGVLLRNLQEAGHYKRLFAAPVKVTTEHCLQAEELMKTMSLNAAAKQMGLYRNNLKLALIKYRAPLQPSEIWDEGARNAPLMTPTSHVQPLRWMA